MVGTVQQAKSLDYFSRTISGNLNINCNGYENPSRDGLNWYAYVGNNPLKWTDPTGLRRTREERRRDRGIRRETRQSRRRSNQQRRETKRRAKAKELSEKGKEGRAGRINDGVDGRAARRANERFLDRVDNYSLGSDLDSFKGFKNELVNNMDKWGALEWQNGGVSDGDMLGVKGSAFDVLTSDTQAGINFRQALRTNKRFDAIVNRSGSSYSNPVDADGHQTGSARIASGTIGSGVEVGLFLSGGSGTYNDNRSRNMESLIAHEFGGHSFYQLNGRNPWTQRGREVRASVIENQYRAEMQGLPSKDHRAIYGKGDEDTNFTNPSYNPIRNQFWYNQ